MIFPTLRGTRCGYANVAEYAAVWLRGKGLSGNPLLDPTVCQQMIDDLHAELGVTWSYGGWLEDRSALWHGSYITERDTPLHLGVDLNVPAGTPLGATRALHVLRIDSDHPEPHGWGTRMVARVLGTPVVLLFAHLQRVQGEVGTVLSPGDCFAEVGTPDQNGGWYSHLHVQAMHEADDVMCLERLLEVDGYGSRDQLTTLAGRFPDPLPLLLS